MVYKTWFTKGSMNEEENWKTAYSKRIAGNITSIKKKIWIILGTNHLFTVHHSWEWPTRQHNM